MLSALESLLLPVACLSCEQTVPGDEPLCDLCRLSLRPIAAPRCARCHQTLDPWERSDAQALGRMDCGLCHSWPGTLAWVASAVWLDTPGAARDLVHALKYDGWQSAARPMARAIARHCGSHLKDAVLVPVPLGRTRLRERGYNQAEVLARALGALTGARVELLLDRPKETRSQTSLSKAERQANVTGAFAKRPGVSASARLILVDDVLTTGATLCAAAEALRQAGVDQLGALTFARAVAPA